MRMRKKKLLRSRRNYGLVPERQVAVAMLGSILSDTHNLR